MGRQGCAFRAYITLMQTTKGRCLNHAKVAALERRRRYILAGTVHYVFYAPETSAVHLSFSLRPKKKVFFSSNLHEKIVPLMVVGFHYAACIVLESAGYREKK